jgi:hypothetical protein
MRFFYRCCQNEFQSIAVNPRLNFSVYDEVHVLIRYLFRVMKHLYQKDERTLPGDIQNRRKHVSCHHTFTASSVLFSLLSLVLFKYLLESSSLADKEISESKYEITGKRPNRRKWSNH